MFAPIFILNIVAFLLVYYMGAGSLFVKILLTEWWDNPFKPPEDFSLNNRQEVLF